MARFIKNRIALILALAACLAVSPFVTPHSLAYADRVSGDNGDPSKGGNGDKSGDPDMPVGPSRTAAIGAQRQTSPTSMTRAGGDGAAMGIAWVWRVRIVLLTLRAYTLRF